MAERLGRGAVACLAASVCLLLLTAAAGESAAVPGLGDSATHPAWSLDLGWSSGWVTTVLVVAYVLGTAGVALGLASVRAGARLRPRSVLLGGVVVAVAVAVLPPVGSGDHLNYAAYGRIAAEGDDPYVDRPTKWRGGEDPVASASQPPWTGTRSVYGPLATTMQAAASAVGGESLRLTVWMWHLIVVMAFAVTAWMLDLLARNGFGPGAEYTSKARTRAALLWTFNPLVLGPAVLGSHLDVVGTAFVVATLALAGRYPLLAGMTLGAAAGTKLPYAVVGLALLWGMRRLSVPAALRTALWGIAGVAVVLVPAHLWAGAHVYDQLERARRYVSLATPWRLAVDVLDPVLGTEPVRAAVATLSLAVAALMTVVVARLTRVQNVRGPDALTQDAVRASWVVAAGWLLSAPYALPWYDVLLWAPLALVGASLVDVAVLVRSAVLALAYVPGRVVGLSPEVEQLTLGFRADVAPWLISAVLLWLVVQALAQGRPVPGPVQHPPARGFARSLR